MTPRFAAILQVCESDLGLARAALESYRLATPGLHTHYFIMDDASPSEVGRQLAEELETHGLKVTHTRLEKPMGYHGLALRFTYIIQEVLECGETFDAVVKFDTDTLFTSADFGRRLHEISEPGGMMIAGIRRKMRKRDAVLMLLDLLPIGLRRRHYADQITHRWGMRWRPTALSRVILSALPHGFRFDYVHGCLAVYSGELIKAIAAKRWMPTNPRQIGLIFTDDVTPSVAAVRYSAEFRDLEPYGTHWIASGTSLQEVDDRGWCFVHAIKDLPENRQLRDQTLQRLRDQTPAVEAESPAV